MEFCGCSGIWKLSSFGVGIYEDRGIAPELQPGDIECLKDAKPDFIAMNYYSTATIAASRGDASDVAARQSDQQIMLGEPGYIVRGKIRMWEKHSTDGL